MDERGYLRNLAETYMKYACSEEMKSKEKLWYEHNDFISKNTPVIMEIDSFINDILPPLKCESKYGREIESYLQYYITNYELVGDDKVIPKEYRVPLQIYFKLFDTEIQAEHSKKAESVGYRCVQTITDLETDVYQLKKSTYYFDEKETEEHFELAKDILGDIMPVVYENQSLRWELMPTKHVVDLMTMQDMFMAMYDCPDELHLLMRKITDDLKEYCFWQQEKGLLTANNGNQYVGAGSYGFTNRLGKSEGKILLTDMWGNMNSQESVGISPAMYEEFFAPYYRELAEMFGAVYYGCCEPANEAWESIKTYKNLKKVSVSAWADEAFMGKVLAENKIIYSRKPSPNFIGVAGEFDEAAFEKYMEKTFISAKDCQLEIIFRDIYTLCGDITKPGRAVNIVRRLSDKYRK